MNAHATSCSARIYSPHVLLVALALIAGGCRDAALGFGPTPETARENADAFIGAYASRFTQVTRAPKLNYVRANLGRGTLVPSRVFVDTATWTARLGDSARVAAYGGTFVGNRYTFALRNPADQLDQPADSYHYTRLRKLGDDEYEWMTAADFVIGHAAPDALPAVLARVLQLAEQRGAAGTRADYRATLPRTTAALGQLYSLDSLRITRDAEGASTIALTIGVSPERLRRTHPALAEYIQKYIGGTTMRVIIQDRRGSRWFEMALRDRRLQMRVRSRNGQLAPLEGPVRALPDSLVVRSDFTTHILLFDVGWSNLLTDMVIVRGSGERAWQFRSTREPRWELPPLTRRFVRTALRRPFAGAGVTFRIGFRELANGHTALYRRGLLRVQETTIIRFLGRLSGQMMGDFYGRSEMEENSFNGAVFAALRADVREALDSR